MNTKSDIAIAIIAKKIDSKIVEYYQSSFGGLRKYLITPDRSSTAIDGIDILHDSEFVDFEYVQRRLKGKRVGWYFQQFLKYQVVLKLPYKQVLIVDGDSILTDRVSLDCLYTTGKILPVAYRNFNKKLLGREYGEERRSFITNQMLFDKALLSGLLEKISDGKTWIDSICENIQKNPEAVFSEYQLYAEYALKVSSVNTQKLRVFRRFDCISDSIFNGLAKYDLLAYEEHHKTGYLRLLRAKIYYLLRLALG